MKIIKNIIWIAIFILAIFVFCKIYSKYNYNDYVKGVSEKSKTNFTRDSNVKYSEMDSYKIENTDYNDAMFSKTISVIPNTPYKVTCRVKVENVESDKPTGGAQICIGDTTERSIRISGTQEWQELTFMFNSKNRDKVDIGFRLGGFEEKSKGIAWFSDFKIESGTAIEDNNWKFGCFIFPKIDVNVEVNGKTERVNLQMSDTDIQDLRNNLARFKNTISNMSDNKIKIDYDLHIIEEPIKTISYDEENEYYISPDDVYEYINSYVEQNEYDYIYVGIRMADIQGGNTTLTNDWVGLGGMEYYGIGFSNIRLPDSESNLIYKYNYNYNTFPEEVYLHEFLHTLERNSREYGYEVPDLHEYAKYGYSEDRIDGQKKWYSDYMNKEIEYNGEKLGLPAEIYTHKPVHESNFKYGLELDYLDEPENIIEIIRSFFNRVGNLIDKGATNEA